MKKLVLLSFLYSSFVFSYRPTVESLFRNGSNPEVEKPSTSYEFSLLKEGKQSPYIFKVFFSEAPGGTELFQVVRDGTNTVLKTKTLNRLESDLRSVKDEQAIFYAVLNSLLRNNSEVMIGVLKTKGVDVSYNRETVNPEKKVLLEKYRTFLERKKKNPNYSDENSPLFSKSKEEKAEVMKLYNESYYAEAEKALLIKEGDSIYWKVLKNNFEALFDHKSRKLQSLKFGEESSVVKMSFQNYFKIDGKHEVPKYIYVNYKGEVYTLQAREYKSLELSEFQSQKINFNKRVVNKETNGDFPGFTL